MQNKIIKKLLIFIFLIILLFLANYFARTYTANLFNKDFKNFNSTGINGHLIEKSITHHTISFKVNNNAKEFVFFPKIKGSKESSDFEYFAELGDSIIKPAFSDTLFLVKGQKLYRYTFNKAE
jgi:hypothetical protein